MARVEDEGLAVSHGGEIVEDQPELGPVGQHLPVTAVGDELLGELGHSGVQVVQQHVDDGRSVTRSEKYFNSIELTTSLCVSAMIRYT